MIKFINYDNDFLELSWEWLNNNEIKKLTKTLDFKKSDQKKWFDNLEIREDYYIKGISMNNVRIGVVGLKNITKKSGEYWGYIGRKEYWGKGIGKLMLKYIEDIAKTKNLKVVYLNVSEENLRAIKLYKKQGYILQSKNKDTLRYFIKIS